MTHRLPAREGLDYLVDTSDDFEQNLSPIVGYACQPLVSLEEACKPLEFILPKLQHYISISKSRSAHQTNHLTIDEAAAIRLYTTQWGEHNNDRTLSLYSQLNCVLRDPDRTKLKPWFLYLKLLMIALTKLPVASTQTVWRGIRHQDSTRYKEGDEKIWWAFSSCTKSLNVLNSDLFLGKTGTRTIFSIETFDGRSVSEYSDFSDEGEVLLLPGTRLKVFAKLNPAPDLHIIELKQLKSNQQLIERPFTATDPLTHTIEAGDTFWALAVKYNCTIDAITAMNPGIDCTKLDIGQVIRLPNMLSPADSKHTSVTDSEIIYHTVFAGDTLDRIAEWYYCTIDDLIHLNPAIQPNLLYPGQKLRLPYNERTKDCREN